jgi:hypothetical protein
MYTVSLIRYPVPRYAITAELSIVWTRPIVISNIGYLI